MTSFLAVLGAGAVFLGAITAVLGFLNQRSARRAVTEAAATAGEVRQISVQVDGRLSMLLERQAQLLAAMHEADIPIPPRPPDPPPP